jgi:hypothetical protein
MAIGALKPGEGRHRSERWRAPSARHKLMSPLAGLKNMFSISFFPRLAPWATR